MDSARIAYVPHPDATPESELNTLAAVYRFILFESHASKKARPTISGPNDAAKEINNGCDDRKKYT